MLISCTVVEGSAQWTWTKNTAELAAKDPTFGVMPEGFRYSNSELMGGATAGILTAVGGGLTSRTSVRIKAAATVGSVQAWVTVKDPQPGFDPTAKAAEAAKAVLDRVSTEDAEGSCSVGPGGAPLPPQSDALPDDTK